MKKGATPDRIDAMDAADRAQRTIRDIEIVAANAVAADGEAPTEQDATLSLISRAMRAVDGDLDTIRRVLDAAVVPAGKVYRADAD